MWNCRCLAALILLLFSVVTASAQTVQPVIEGVFSFPVGIAMDGTGNIYVADDKTNTISKVTPGGTVSVFITADQGLDRPESIAFDAAGQLYVANSGNDTISVITPAGAVSAFVTGGIGVPMGLVLDAAGNLYVSDSAGNAIHKITPAGAVSVFSQDQNFLNSPIGMAFDGKGNLYVANLLPTPQDSAITLITPQGVASTFVKFDANGLLFPAALGFDSHGTLFAATAMGQIFEISPSGSVASFDTKSFVSPRGLIIDRNNNLFITDLTAATLIELTPQDVPRTVAGNVLASPTFMALDRAGNLLVANSGSRIVSKIAPDGSASVFVPRGLGVEDPAGMAFDAGGTLFLADAETKTIVTVAADGTVTPFIDLSAEGAVPEGLAFDRDGNLFVADGGNNQILKITPGGTVTAVATQAQGVIQPQGLAFDGTGNLFIASAGAGTVLRLAPDGTVTTVVPVSVGLSAPQSLAFDSNGTLYVSNSPGGVLPPGIAAVSPGGAVTMFVQGAAELGNPTGLVFQPGQTLFAVDVTSNDLVRISVPPPSGSLPAPLLASVLPGARSVELGAPATVFATILNTGATDLTGCGITLAPTAPAALSLSFQTTDPATNRLIGTPGQPVSIAANSSQSFLLSVGSTTPLTVAALAPVFGCNAVQPAPVVPGVNTIDLSFSAGPVADIVALAATAPQPGVVDVPFSSGLPGAFALASVNAGASGDLTVTVDTGAASLPLSILLCPTDPSTGQCLQPMAPSVPMTIATGDTPTFSVFVSAMAPVAFAPGTSRIFVRFVDGTGQSHGSTSVAVRTQ
jgi:YVTN family beta-propeller protein